MQLFPSGMCYGTKHNKLLCEYKVHFIPLIDPYKVQHSLLNLTIKCLDNIVTAIPSNFHSRQMPKEPYN